MWVAKEMSLSKLILGYQYAVLLFHRIEIRFHSLQVLCRVFLHLRINLRWRRARWHRKNTAYIVKIMTCQEVSQWSDPQGMCCSYWFLFDRVLHRLTGQSSRNWATRSTTKVVGLIFPELHVQEENVASVSDNDFSVIQTNISNLPSPHETLL